MRIITKIKTCLQRATKSCYLYIESPLYKFNINNPSGKWFSSLTIFQKLELMKIILQSLAETTSDRRYRLSDSID